MKNNYIGRFLACQRPLSQGMTRVIKHFGNKLHITTTIAFLMVESICLKAWKQNGVLSKFCDNYENVFALNENNNFNEDTCWNEMFEAFHYSVFTEPLVPIYRINSYSLCKLSQCNCVILYWKQSKFPYTI